MDNKIVNIDLDNLGFTPSQELINMVNDANQSMAKAEQSKLEAQRTAMNYQNMQNGSAFDNTAVSFDTNQMLNGGQMVTPIDIVASSQIPNMPVDNQLLQQQAAANAALQSIQLAAGAGRVDPTPGAAVASDLTPKPAPKEVTSQTMNIPQETTGSAGVERIDPTPGAIVIPSNISQTGIIPNYTNYQYFKNKWNNGTAQQALSQQWMAAGETSNRGIATLNNRYLVAVSPKFGKVGDNIDVCLDDGTIIPATIADAKGGDAKSEWGHTFGNAVDVIEWESNGSKDVIDLTGWQGHKVSSITNKGTML